MELWITLTCALVGAALGLPLASAAERLLRTPRALSRLARAGATVASGVLVAIAWSIFGFSWETPAYLYLCGVAIVLSIVDLMEKRLPNPIVYPSLVVMPALLILAAALSDSWPRLLWAAVGAIALFAVYFVLALISPSGIGMGDVKLSALIGFALGYLGWTPVLIGGTAGFIIAGLVSTIALLARLVTLRGSIPFGPAMFAGAFVGILAS